jgi:hypothetical protein
MLTGLPYPAANSNWTMTWLASLHADDLFGVPSAVPGFWQHQDFIFMF